MPLQAILHEVDELHNVSTRFEGLAEQYPPVSEALVTIAGSVRNTATMLAVLVATRSPEPIFSRTKWTVWAFRKMDVPSVASPSQTLLSASKRSAALRRHLCRARGFYPCWE